MYLIPILTSIIVIGKMFFYQNQNTLNKFYKLLVATLLVILSSCIQYKILFSDFYVNLASNKSFFLFIVLMIILLIIPYLISRVALLFMSVYTNKK